MYPSHKFYGLRTNILITDPSKLHQIDWTGLKVNYMFLRSGIQTKIVSIPFDDLEHFQKTIQELEVYISYCLESKYIKKL